MTQTLSYRGKTALITGASAGIGAEYARQYAALGANLILVARREDKLHDLQSSLAQHDISIRLEPGDLSKPETPIAIMQRLTTDNVAVDILINNAGFGLPGGFENTTWQDQRDFIELMVTSYASFSHGLFKLMMQRGYGRIINVASVAGLVPSSAGHTLYGASKAFLISMSEALHSEGAANNVYCSATCPGFTYSEFHDVNGSREGVNKLPEWMFMQAEPVVHGSILAAEKGKSVYVPGTHNKIISALSRAMPRSWAQAMAGGQLKKYRKV